ncbi:MAG TPA: tetratricopeptide repeat protein [Pyrinomonadaceae bacterium]
MGKPSVHGVYEFGDFRLDAGHLMLYRKDEELALAPKAVETLLALVERRGQIVSKDELLEAVWPDAIVEESNLFLYLSVLRKTLGTQTNGKPWVETLRRRGYRFSGSVRVIPATNGDGAPRVEPFPLHVVPSRLPDADNAPDEIRPRPFRWWNFAAAGLLTAVVALTLAYSYFLKHEITSIAVMPFENENAELEYLSDGMTETLIESLSRLPKLNVKARSSVFRYKNKEKDAATIGRELNVRAILNGRVVQHGDRLTVYLELVDAQTGDRIWGNQYTRNQTNIISLQREIARDVLDKLSVRLSGADEQELAKNPTLNVEAYQLYLKGRHHAMKLTPQDTKKGLSYFQEAIDLDPNYALAYVGIADANFPLALTGNIAPNEAFPTAKSAVDKALEIDSNLGEAHATSCWIAFWYEWDWSGAEQHCKRAIELNPNNGDAHRAYAHLLSNIGRHDEAFAEMKRSLEVDPLDLRTNAQAGQALIHAGKVDEALVSLQKSIDFEPNFWMSHLFLASAYIEKERYDEAVAAAQKQIEMSPAQTHGIAYLGYALARSGKHEEARAVLRELLDRFTKGFVPPYRIALVYNGLDDKENALVWLEKGLNARDPMMTFLKVEPKWNNLRSDPRFRDVLRRMGFPPNPA